MHTLPDFLSWSVLSCLSFSRTLQILAMAHVSQVGVSCVPCPGLPPTELPRWAHRPSLPGSTHRGYRVTPVWVRSGWRQFCRSRNTCEWACTGRPPPSSVKKAYHVLTLDSASVVPPGSSHIPTFFCPAPRSERDCVWGGASTSSSPLIFISQCPPAGHPISCLTWLGLLHPCLLHSTEDNPPPTLCDLSLLHGHTGHTTHADCELICAELTARLIIIRYSST